MRDRHGRVAWGLTFDIRGDRRQAQLDEGVRSMERLGVIAGELKAPNELGERVSEQLHVPCALDGAVPSVAWLVLVIPEVDLALAVASNG